MDKDRLISILQRYEQEHEKTLRIIELFSDEELKYKFWVDEPTLGGSIYKIYNTELVWAEGARDGRVDQDKADDVQDVQTVEEAKQYAIQSLQKLRSILFEMTDEDLNQEVELSFGGKSPAWKCFLNAFVKHVVERDALYKFVFVLRKDDSSV